MKSKSRRLTAAVTTIFAVATGLAVAAVNTARATSIDRAPIGAFVSDGCDHHCRTCGENKHDIVVAQVNEHTSSHLENCNTGTCTSHECGGSFAEMERVRTIWSAVSVAEGDALEELIEDNTDIVSYNEQRHAVQIRCSRGSLVASLPLTNEQAASIVQ